MEAFKWFEIAAKNGLPQAQYELAVCYHRGRGTAVNLPRLTNGAGWRRATHFTRRWNTRPSWIRRWLQPGRKNRWRFPELKNNRLQPLFYS